MVVIAAGLLSALTTARAENTGGVFGPVVNHGHRSGQYRAGYDTGTYGLAQRLHYQHALDGNRMWRVILQARKTPDSDFDADFVQAELFWQLGDFSSSWRHGFRFDLRVRTEGRPAQLGVNWTNEIDINERWRARWILLAATDVGESASGDVRVSSRASLMYRGRPGISMGLETFNTYGALGDVPALDEQSHVLGPALAANVGDDWQLFASALVGLTDASPDAQLRVWFGRPF